MLTVVRGKKTVLSAIFSRFKFCCCCTHLFPMRFKTGVREWNCGVLYRAEFHLSLYMFQLDRCMLSHMQRKKLPDKKSTFDHPNFQVFRDANIPTFGGFLLLFRALYGL